MLARISKQELDHFIKKEVGIENGSLSLSFRTHLFSMNLSS